MKFALIICDDESDSPTMEELFADPRKQAFESEIKSRNSAWIGVRLRPVANASTIRVRNGETLVSDGPFAETKDFIGGVGILECSDLDEAIAIAAKHPWAYKGVVEIRPIWE